MATDCPGFASFEVMSPAVMLRVKNAVNCRCKEGTQVGEGESGRKGRAEFDAENGQRFTTFSDLRTFPACKICEISGSSRLSKEFSLARTNYSANPYKILETGEQHSDNVKLSSFFS